MNYSALLLVALCITCKTKSSIPITDNKINLSDTIPFSKQQLTDTIIQNIQPGFYLALPDTSNSKGLKVYNKEEYYFLGTSPIVTMVQIDTVYKDFNPNINNYILIFKFNKVAIDNWFDFTKKYQGLKAGLVINDKLVYVATIASPISGGVSWLAGSHSEKEIDNFKGIFEIEIQKAKGLQ